MSEMDLTQPSPAHRGEGEDGPDARSTDRLRRIVESELLPRFLISHGVRAMPSGFRSVGSSLVERSATLLTLLRAQPEQQAVDNWIEETIADGYSLDEILDDVVTPIARRMGVLWEEDECDFVEVTMVCARIQSSIRRLARRFSHPHDAGLGRILVAGLPGANHTLGLLMVAESFSRAGYQVDLGEPLVHGIHPKRYDILAFTLSRTERVDEARAYLDRQRALAGSRLRVIVGGAAFRTDPDLVERLGADGWAQDPHAALTLIDGLMHPELRTLPDSFLETAPRGHVGGMS